MSINRTGLSVTDDDGSELTGTIWNNANRTALLDALDSRWTIVVNTTTGNQNNVSITSGGVEADILYLAGSADTTITGIAAPASPAKVGKRLVVINTGTANAFLDHQSGSSSAANQLYHRVTSANLPLAGNGAYGFVEYHYNGTGWVQIGHDQGAYIQATFAAGDFTGNGSQTWTLASGDRLASGYKLSGNTMHYFFTLSTTTVGGTPNTQLRIASAEWGGFTPLSNAMYRRCAYVLDNNTVAEAFCVPASTNLVIQRTDGANWAASTNLTSTYGDAHFSVT